MSEQPVKKIAVVDAEALKGIQNEKDEIKEKLVKTQDELTDIKMKVEEYEAEKAQAALEQFERDKSEVLGMLGDDEERKQYVEQNIHTPQQLQVVKQIASTFNAKIRELTEKQDRESAKPFGKASMEDPNSQKSSTQTQKEYIEKLYETIRDPQANRELKKRANAEIDKLWQSLRKNPNWEKLRNEANKKTTSGKSTYDYAVSGCPVCGQVNTSPKTQKLVTCSKCNEKYPI